MADEVEQLVHDWRLLSYNDLEFFGEYCFRTDEDQPVRPTPFHSKWCSALDSDDPRLLIVSPPGSAKSMWTSVIYSTWFLGRNPDKHVLLVSNTATQANLFSVAARDTVEHNRRYRLTFPSVVPDKAKGWAEHEWFVKRPDPSDKDASFATVGVGGPAIGRRADLILVDDIHDEENTATIAQMDKVDRWFRRTIYSRLQPHARIIVICTRWHEADVYGRLIDEGWPVLHFPAIDSKGKALWPERWPKKKLLEVKKFLGSYLFEGMYQGNPVPLEGGLFKREWWQYYVGAPDKFDEMLQSWDMTFKDTKSGSFVVGQVWGRKGANKYLLDQVRARMDFPGTKKALKALTAKWPQVELKLVEAAANGPAIIDELKDTVSGLVAVKPRGSKEARASAVSAQIEAGNVYLPSDAPWLSDFMEEVSAFPKGLKDDQVDSMTQALVRLGGRAVVPTFIKQPMKENPLWNMNRGGV